jgi:phosphoserine phosphatase
MPGAKTLLATMKKHGATCVLVSGGFTFFTEKIKAQTGFDHTHANILNFEDGVLTGEVTEPILDKDSKQEFLEDYQQKLQLTKDDIIAVGDGANDIPMLQAAGVGVAYHAKQHVKDLIGCAIDHHDLSALLFIQGYRREEFVD